MKVLQTPPVEIALRTLGPEDRQEVLVWFDHLKIWENDAFLRHNAKQVNSSANVYVLKASGDFRIFFRLEQDRIVLLDLTTKATIVGSGMGRDVFRLALARRPVEIDNTIRKRLRGSESSEWE